MIAAKGTLTAAPCIHVLQKNQQRGSNLRTLYCGGTFCFDYTENDYLENASKDYRAQLLGHRDLLLHRNEGIVISPQVTYIGPFYFESDGMTDADIVRIESEMINQCTDAIFLLDEASCPGTIGELTLSSTMHKQVHIFYVRKPDTEETESCLHTPCWFPIILSRQINPNTILIECSDIDDATAKIISTVESWTD